MITAQEQVRQITHGVSGIINEEDLVKKIERSIKENKPLIVNWASILRLLTFI